MIDRVHFENFKSLQDVTVQLGRLTVLVGANGCGKSSVLMGISQLSARVRPAFSNDGTPRPFTRVLSYRGTADRVKVSLQTGGATELGVETRFDANGAPTAQLTQSLGLASVSLASTTYLHLDASKMSVTSIIETERPRMEPDGRGLASALAWMKGAAEDELARLTTDLLQVVPGVRRIRTFRERVSRRRIEKLDVEGQPVWRSVDKTEIGDRFAIEFDDGSEIPSNMLSEGTVLALGLLTKLREPERPKLVLIDDVDRGLHLGAQVSLIKVLRELLRLDPELQIVCTTHSPYLLDLFAPEEVRVLALDAERRTHVRPLTEHPDFDKWKFGTQTGELWAALGEDWVLAGASE
ncbi:MAG TPA: AAA family ATPase [Kofleriaceae bacterium]